jgi:diacylglycerol kinase (ATP)
MKTMFIINPVSGKGKGSRPFKMIRNIHEAFGKAKVDFAIRIWDHPDHLGKLIAEAIEGKFEVVVAVGGDGTINDIGKRLVGTGIALGVVPIGSGNGFARHLGYSLRHKKAITQLLSANPVEVDTGDFGGIPFINNAGIGIDAFVAERFSHSKTRGLQTYVKLASKAIMEFETFDATLLVDGKREYKCRQVMLMDIANGPNWGGGAVIAPLSTISDGWLEAVIWEKTPYLAFPNLVMLLFQGKIYRHPSIKIVRGKTFEITRTRSGDAHVDGESVKLGSTISAHILEKSVRLLVPQHRAAV